MNALRLDSHEETLQPPRAAFWAKMQEPPGVAGSAHIPCDILSCTAQVGPTHHSFHSFAPTET